MITSGNYERKKILLNHISTGILEHGKGDAVVALHGIPTSSLLYLPLFSKIPEFRLIAPDLLGQGLTEVPESGRLDFKAYADHLRSFMDNIAPAQFHLVVHDLGGVLGLDWATQNPGRLKSLTVLSTTITKSLRVGKLLYAANLVFGRSLLNWGLDSTLRRSEKLDRSLSEEWVRPWSRGRILRGMDHFSPSHLLRVHSGLKRIDRPALVIWGKQDNIFPLSHAESILQSLPQAKFHIIDQCGHWSPLDAPDEIAEQLTQFWNQPA